MSIEDPPPQLAKPQPAANLQRLSGRLIGGRAPLPLLLVTAALAGCLAAVVVVRYAGPVLDGDLFFHLAYAQQIRDTGSLVPDPTIYSWTPTSRTAIYCSWASELALDAVWRAWFQDQARFTYGGIFDDFQTRYPARLAVIEHRQAACERNFLDSPDWRAIFYGPTAAVFVRRGDERPGEAADPPPHGGLAHLHNGVTALRVFDFATAAGDLAAAWPVLEQAEGPLRRQIAPAALQIREAYRDAWSAIARRDYARAGSLLQQGLTGRAASQRDRQAQALLADRAAGRRGDAARIEAALAALAAH